MAAATQLPISGDFSSGSWIEASSFADTRTGVQLDLNSLFASIDDALGDSGSK